MRASAWACVVCLAVALAASPATGFEFRSGDAVVVGEDEVIADDLIVTGRTVTIRGQVDGSVVACGEKVTLEGSATGLMLGCGQRVQVNAAEAGSVGVAGQTIEVSGKVKRNLAVAASEVTLNEDAGVGRDAIAAGAEVTCDGTVGRDLQVASGILRVSGDIGRNLVANCDEVLLGPGSLIRGDFVSHSSEPPVVPDEATVEGAVVHRPPTKPARTGPNWRMMAALFILRVAGMFLVGCLMVTLAPRSTDQLLGNLRTQPGQSVGLGALGLFLLPVIACMLVVTVLGSPVGLLLMLLYAAALFIAFAVSATALGDVVLRGRKSRVLAALLGAVIIGLAMAVPVVGWLTFLAAAVFGLGALLLASASAVSRQRTESVAT